MKSSAFLPAFALAAMCACSTPPTPENIRINQVGFYPDQEKTLTLEQNNKCETVEIYKAGTDEKVWEGTQLRSAVSPWSGKERRIFDFSEITEPGTYTVKAGKDTADFTISQTAYDELAKAALTAFYHQRSGMDLDPEIAGKWARKGGHPDDKDRPG
jgi:endoglucanase